MRSYFFYVASFLASVDVLLIEGILINCEKLVYPLLQKSVSGKIEPGVLLKQKHSLLLSLFQNIYVGSEVGNVSFGQAVLA